MDVLPDELVLAILAVLDPKDISTIQCSCKRLYVLARDDNLWKLKCFQHSHSEALRRRQEQLASQGSELATLRRAMNDVTHAGHDHAYSNDVGVHDRHIRALTNWDPGWPHEKPDYYQEYIQRHGPISVEWLKASTGHRGTRSVAQEATGVGLFRGGSFGLTDQVFAPMEDGSACLWDVSTRHLTKSSPGLLEGSLFGTASSSRNRQVPGEVSALENVTIDNQAKKAYVAVREQLLELDLQTFQVSRCQAFPFPVSCLGPATYKPMVVGTTMTLHLFDRRARPSSVSSDSSRCELIAGQSIYSSTMSAHVNLSERHPLSIQHLPEPASDQFWVAGRFTSLLNYDRRFWPVIRTTLFSGARLSSLSLLPNSYVPRDLDLFRTPALSPRDIQIAKRREGMTLVAAGEYRGKGSVELYDLPQGAVYGVPGHLRHLYARDNCYKNRQSAARTRVLSVCPNGLRLVYSDGDGNLKWVERDGSTVVRQLNINDFVNGTQNTDILHQEHSLLFQSADEVRGAEDIVRRILPMSQDDAKSLGEGSDLLVWTGEGRVGTIGFHRAQHVSNVDQAQNQHDVANDLQQRQYDQEMRRALERQADDARIARGFGLAFMEGL